MQEQYGTVATQGQARSRGLVKNHTQEDRVLWVLQAAYPNWVPAVQLSHISLQYNARIFSLRRQGWQIENKVEVQPGGTKHGQFRLARPMTFPNPKPHAVVPAGPATSLFGDLTPGHKDLG